MHVGDMVSFFIRIFCGCVCSSVVFQTNVNERIVDHPQYIWDASLYMSFPFNHRTTTDYREWWFLLPDCTPVDSADVINARMDEIKNVTRRDNTFDPMGVNAALYPPILRPHTRSRTK